MSQRATQPREWTPDCGCMIFELRVQPELEFLITNCGSTQPNLSEQEGFSVKQNISSMKKGE